MQATSHLLKHVRKDIEEVKKKKEKCKEKSKGAGNNNNDINKLLAILKIVRKYEAQKKLQKENVKLERKRTEGEKTNS